MIRAHDWHRILGDPMKLEIYVCKGCGRLRVAMLEPWWTDPPDCGAARVRTFDYRPERTHASDWDRNEHRDSDPEAGERCSGLRRRKSDRK